jgi:hypothetical protein
MSQKCVSCSNPANRGSLHCQPCTFVLVQQWQQQQKPKCQCRLYGNCTRETNNNQKWCEWCYQNSLCPFGCRIPKMQGHDRCAKCQAGNNSAPMSQQRVQPVQQYVQPVQPVQSQQLCQICPNAAAYINGKFAPGCCRSHSIQADQQRQQQQQQQQQQPKCQCREYGFCSKPVNPGKPWCNDCYEQSEKPTQGQPLCQVCPKKAKYINGKFTAGCCPDHSIFANNVLKKWGPR